MRRSIVQCISRHEKNKCLRHLISRTHTAADVEVISSVKSFEEIPGPSGRYAIPYLGIVFNFKPFGKHSPDKFHLLVKELNAKYGDVVRVRDRSGWQVFLYNPDDVRTIFENEGRYPYRYDAASQLVTTYRKDRKVPPGIADAQGEEWAKIRSPLQQYFSRPSAAARFLEAQNSVGDELLHFIRQKGCVLHDSVDEFMKYTAESIGMVCFDKRIGCLNQEVVSDFPGDLFLAAVRKAFMALRESFTTAPWFVLFPTRVYKDFSISLDTMTEIAGEEVRKCIEMSKRRKETEENPENMNLITALLNDGRLNTEQIADGVTSMVGAGVESTAKNLAILLYFLARNPEKQEKLRTQIKEILNGDGLTESTIDKLTYLRVCLKESMRLIPPNTLGTVRSLPRDIVISGYEIPKGTQLAIASIFPSDYSIDRKDEYIPERWLKNSGMDRVDPFQFVPFGHGPRNCLGKKIAEQEIYVAIVKILQNYKVDIPEEYKNRELLEYVYNLNPTPIKPLTFYFEEV